MILPARHTGKQREGSGAVDQTTEVRGSNPMLVMGAVDAPLWSFFSLFGVVKERGEPRPPRAKSPAKPRPPGGSGGSKSPKKGDRPRGSKKVYLEDLYYGRALKQLRRIPLAGGADSAARGGASASQRTPPPSTIQSGSSRMGCHACRPIDEAFRNPPDLCSRMRVESSRFPG